MINQQKNSSTYIKAFSIIVVMVLCVFPFQRAFAQGNVTFSFSGVFDGNPVLRNATDLTGQAYTLRVVLGSQTANVNTIDTNQGDYPIDQLFIDTGLGEEEINLAGADIDLRLLRINNSGSMGVHVGLIGTGTSEAGLSSAATLAAVNGNARNLPAIPTVSGTATTGSFIGRGPGNTVLTTTGGDIYTFPGTPGLSLNIDTLLDGNFTFTQPPASVPTLSEWGIIVLILGLAGMAAVRMRRINIVETA